MDGALVGSGYADHLTDADLSLLVSASQDTETSRPRSASVRWSAYPLPTSALSI